MAARHPPPELGHIYPVELVPPSINDLDPSMRQRLATTKQLYVESDFDSAMSTGKLVDNPDHCDNLHLWLMLLDFRERLQGFDGVKKVWRGLRLRNVALPVDGALANTLWNRFLDLGLTDQNTMESILLHARAQYDKTGQRWPGVYEKIIGHYLRNDPLATHQWHDKLRTNHPPHPDCLRALAGVASRSKKSLTAFRWIYLRCGQRNVYPALIPLLCSRRKYRLALKWHFWLIKMGDLPPSLDMVTEHLAPGIGKSDLEEVIRSLKEERDFPTKCEPNVTTTKRVITGISRRIRDIMATYGGKFAIPQKPTDDEIYARCFVTEGWSVNAVLNGMEILGVKAIGPLSLRELAIREKTPEKVANRIVQMEKAGISIGKSVFSRLVKKLSINHKAALLTDVLLCDQHPDVFEDRDTQISLLVKYLDQADWRQFRRTISVLTELSHDPEMENWNVVLQVLLKCKKERVAHQLLEHMKMKGMFVKQESIFCLVRGLLRRRNQGKAPVSNRKHRDDLGLARNLLSGIIQSGSRVQPRIWRELMIRFGMAGRLDELESLVLWLLQWYGPSKRELDPGASHSGPRLNFFASTPGSENAYYILFHPHMVNGLIAWGFVHELSRLRSPVRYPAQVSVTNVFRPKAHPWTRGLRLVKELEKRGVRIPIATVRRACQLRLLSLYGPAISKRRLVWRMIEGNSHTLSEMVAEIESIYPALFRLTRKLEGYTSVRSLLRDVMRFRPHGGYYPRGRKPVLLAR
ncbi:MAG: hypothetical protein M1839_003819 [Geoglossum umbratile]|nr:MAG: hypothetical protein M1839_003819 [Geoglossum umbratile]